MNCAVFRGATIFYSLGELQVRVFDEKSRTDGRDITIFVDFGRFFDE